MKRPPARSRAAEARPARVAAALGAAVVLLAVSVYASRGVIESAAALFPLAGSPHPYFAPAHAGLLYIGAPLAVLSAALLFLAPGLLLALAWERDSDAGQWISRGFALSLLIVSVATGVAQAAVGRPLRGGSFVVVVAVCALACLGVLMRRMRRDSAWFQPFRAPHATTTLVSMIVFPLALLIALAPKFYWENFNGDGAHAYESARLLLVRALPFWDPAVGSIAIFPGLTSMLFAFPASWFIRLFGEVEAAVRLPFLLHLVAVYGGVLALVEHGRTQLGAAERWLIWAGLAVYTVVMSFSATYDPYSADIALPAAQDTLLMACYLGFLLAFLRRERAWMSLFAALTFLASPNGLLLLGLWMLAVWALWKPRPWRELLWSAAMVGGCVAVAAAAPRLLAAVNVPVAGGEYGPLQLFKRFAILQWADWHRLAFLVIPGGIVPAVALLAWRRQDQAARTVALVTVAYFALFYVQAHIALHYFAPVMLLPLIVYWRMTSTWQRPARRLAVGGAALASLAALVVSLPAKASPQTTARLIGAAIEDRAGGYERFDPAAFRRAALLDRILPYDSDPRVPAQSYGGSSLAWNYYARARKTKPEDVNYVLQREDDPPPDSMRLVASSGDGALYVKSEAVLREHRALRPPTPAGSPLYSIPRGFLFSGALGEDAPVIRVKKLLKKLGIDVDQIRRSVG